MPIKAILWDIDGTLLNTETLNNQCIKKACQSKGLTIDYDQLAIGTSNYDLWKILKISDAFSSPENWLQAISDEYKKLITPHVIKSGVIDVLEQIKKLGIRQAAVSNGSKSEVDVNLKQTNLEPFFECIISRNDVMNPKPHGEPYIKALKQMDLNAEEAIAIEDTPIGIKSARNAGLFVIAFPSNATLNYDFSQANAVVYQASKLLEIILKPNRG